MAAANGSAHANGKLNGQVVVKTRHRRQQRGFLFRSLSFIARIATWVTIFTILFRCPETLEACNDQSPLICKPYFRAKHAVTPHVQPYYDLYAAPYVDVAKPYYKTLNEHVLQPGRHYSIQYGWPLVKKGQDVAYAQWTANGQPRLLKLQTLAKTHFDRSLAPQLDKASEIITPYYDLALKHFAHAYKGYVLPTYEIARPFAVRGYDAALDFTTSTALPAGFWAWNKANAFLDTAIWPQLRVVYVANVEPQLNRIGERLARYRTKSKATSKVSLESSFVMSSTTSQISSSFSKPTPQSPSTASASPDAEETEILVTDTEANSGGYWNPVQPPPATENESDVRKTAREMVANDLATWQNKFAAQAEEGAGAMEDQVEEIAQTMMNENAKVNGKALLKELEDTIAREVVELKFKIISIVKTGSSQAENEVVSAIRSAGSVIKKTAQTVRGWREDYDAELQETVLEAAEVHFQILDETRGLALQNIGMKWAWADGVTYKDWQKYHELKNTLNSWTEDLKQLIVSHPALVEAQELSHQIEDDGMTMAGVAAKELGRLKEVSMWKIQASDASDNFDSDEMRLAAEAAEQAKKPAMEVQEDTLEAATEIMKESSGSVETSSAAQDDTSSSETHSEETPVILLEPVVKDSVTEPEESPLVPEGQVSVEDIAADDESLTHTVEEAATPSAGNIGSSVTSALFGAAAQSVADRKPIIEDDDADADTIASLTSAAQAAYSSAVALAADQYSSAVSVVSAQVHGTSKPVHEQLFSSVSAAYGGAMSAASQKLSEAVAAASSYTQQAAPSPTKSSNLPDWSKIESIAAQRLNEGRLWAEIQYQSMLIAVGATTATPTSTPEKYYEQAKYHYFAGLGLAQDRYSSFLSAASSAWSSATATPTPTDFIGSASSIASVAGKSAASAASVADGAVKSAYGAASKGVMSAAQEAQDSIESVADAAAEQIVNAAGVVADTWDVVVARISADVYGQPSAIGWYDGASQTAGSAVSAATEAVADSLSSASSAAAEQLAAMNKLISELVVGKEPTFSESVMSRLSAVYATATSHVGSVASDASVAAASVGDRVGSAASQATEAVKEATQKIRDEL